MINIRSTVRGIIKYYTQSRGVDHSRLAYDGLSNGILFKLNFSAKI